MATVTKWAGSETIRSMNHSQDTELVGVCRLKYPQFHLVYIFLVSLHAEHTFNFILLQ
jgi:hypothetical protein